LAAGAVEPIILFPESRGPGGGGEKFAMVQWAFCKGTSGPDAQRGPPISDVKKKKEEQLDPRPM